MPVLASAVVRYCAEYWPVRGRVHAFLICSISFMKRSNSFTAETPTTVVAAAEEFVGMLMEETDGCLILLLAAVAVVLEVPVAVVVAVITLSTMLVTCGGAAGLNPNKRMPAGPGTLIFAVLAWDAEECPGATTGKAVEAGKVDVAATDPS
jgi:hypothetical protein